MRKIEVEENKILNAYENADASGKKLLLRIFDEGIFVKRFEKPKPKWVCLWDKFCEENDLNIQLPYSNPKNPKEERTNAFEMICCIVEIKIHQWSKDQKLKTDWVPDWNNSDERKYFPCFDMQNNENKNHSSSFGFTVTHYGNWFTLSAAGSRLCYPTAELCEKTAIEFLPIYEKFFKH